ncbi:uncharacterized protein EV422DRAFT_217919 [Fimicolochytrium jonesii]|uniref:uncharacterized protein n=1 Tax=Fimicolochytrium jonesii TaxID=1396493 RepID=UPI0022FEAA0C|nr:uncharacterized protein EV422DRAFT_217919 [Fimicolochytrium jonesii]KAI8817557.1 hypothetical protein EV422DRAFT_217919 [Fimicolochytrium jonesii]
MLSDPDISSTSGDDTDARLEAEDLTEYSFTTDSMDPTSPIWNATVEKASPGPLQKSDAVSNTARGGSEDITGPVKRKTDELVSGAYAEVTPEIVGGASIRKPVDTQHVDVKKPMEVRADTNTRKADAAQGVEARNLIEVPPDTNVRKVDGPQGVDVKSLMKVRPDTSNRKADASQGVEFEKRMEMVPHTNIRRADGSTGVEVEKIMEAQAGIRKAMNQQPKTSPTQGGQASRANVLLKQPPIAAEPPKRHDKPAAASSSDPSPKRVTVANISSVVQPPHIIKHVITVQPKHGHSSVQPGVAASRPLVKPTAKPHHSVKSASNDQPAKKDRFLRSLDNRSLSGAEQFQRPLNVRRMLGQAGPADLPSHWTPVTAEEGWYYGKRIMPEKKEEDEGRVVKTKETEKAKALFVLNMPYSSTPKDLNDMIEGFGLHPISAQFGYTKGGARTPLSLVRLPTEAEAEEAVARIQAQSNTKQWHNILATRTLMEWPSSVDKDERIIFRGGEDVFDVEEEEEEDVDEDEEGDEESGASTDSTSDLSESSELSVD